LKFFFFIFLLIKKKCFKYIFKKNFLIFQN